MNISKFKKKNILAIFFALFCASYLDADDYGVTEQKLSEIEARLIR